jgi:hypothetical protein
MTELEKEIYIQLLELYQYDLEVELMCEKLKNVKTGNPPMAVPYPWEQPQPNPWTQPWRPGDAPIYYGPPYRVTCTTSSNKDLGYSEKYDAHYSKSENVWLDDKCTDPSCKYCSTRPERPL